MQNRVKMYFDFESLRIGEKYVALEEDVHISSIIRLAQKITLKPQHLHTCIGQTKFRNGGSKKYEIEQLSSGYVCNFSGISAANTVVKIAKSCRFLLLIMNNTNQMVTLKWRCPIAKFLIEEVTYMGHTLTYVDLKPDEEKVQAITEFPAPHDLHHLRLFIRMVKYLSKFDHSLMTKCEPLNRLTWNDQVFL